MSHKFLFLKKYKKKILYEFTKYQCVCVRKRNVKKIGNYPDVNTIYDYKEFDELLKIKINYFINLRS